MKKILIAYASKKGATAEIARKIGEVLNKKGYQVDIVQAEKVEDLTSYEVVLLGSAVYMGMWRKEAVKLLKERADQLGNMPVWLFISGPTGEGDPLKLTDGWLFPESLRPVIEEIKPQNIICFSGKLDAKNLNAFEKWIVNKVKAPIGDYRNWETIAAWAEEVGCGISSLKLDLQIQTTESQCHIG